jgi:hypothetical protein
MFPSPSLGAPLLSGSPSPPLFWGIPEVALASVGAGGGVGAFLATVGVGVAGTGCGVTLGAGAFLATVGVGVVATGRGATLATAAWLGLGAGALVVTVGVGVAAGGCVATLAAGAIGVCWARDVPEPAGTLEVLAAEPQAATTRARPTAPRLTAARRRPRLRLVSAVRARGLPSTAPTKVWSFERIIGLSFLVEEPKADQLRDPRAAVCGFAQMRLQVLGRIPVEILPIVPGSPIDRRRWVVASRRRRPARIAVPALPAPRAHPRRSQVKLLHHPGSTFLHFV